MGCTVGPFQKQKKIFLWTEFVLSIQLVPECTQQKSLLCLSKKNFAWAPHHNGNGNERLQFANYLSTLRNLKKNHSGNREKRSLIYAGA